MERFRFGAAVQTPPRGRRRTERLLERAGECRLRVVADTLGNLCKGCACVAELLGRDLHAPTGEVVHRRHVSKANETIGPGPNSSSWWADGAAFYVQGSSPRLSSDSLANTR